MKKIFVNIGLLSVTLFLLFLLTEGVIRIFFPVYSPRACHKHKNENFMEFNTSYGWFHKRNFTTWLESQEYATKIVLNEKGLRGKEYPYEKQPGTKRIAVLGDSFAFGLGVDGADTFSVKLEELFRKHGEKADVVNMGVNGYGSDQEYLLLKEEGVKYGPDIVVCLFFVGNDIQNNASSSQMGKLKPYYVFEENRVVLKNYPVPSINELVKLAGEDRKPRCRIGIPFKAFLQEHSYAYVFFRLRYNYLLYRLGIRRTADSSTFPGDFALTESIFLKMKEFCDRHNIGLLILIIPTREQMMGIEKDDIQLRLMEFSEKHGIEYLNLLDMLRGRTDLNFIIDSHWNKKGHNFIAQILYDRLNNQWTNKEIPSQSIAGKTI